MNKLKYHIKATLVKVCLVILIFTGLTAETYGQDHGIHQVKLDFYHSLRIPNHHVSVEFQRYGGSMSSAVVKKLSTHSKH